MDSPVEAGVPGSSTAEIAATLEGLARLVIRMNTGSALSLTTAVTLSDLNRLGPLRLTELAERAGVTQPAMTQLVSRLQEAGLAVRAGDPEDGRVVRVHITDAGRTALAERQQTRAAVLAELLCRLGERERASLVAALPVIDDLTRMLPEDWRGPAGS